MAIDCVEFMRLHTLDAFMEPKDLLKDMDTLMTLTEAADHGFDLDSNQIRESSYFVDVHYYTCSK